MTLQEQIKTGIKDAMKAKDTVRLSVLRGLSTAFVNKLIADKKMPQDSLSDDDAMLVIKQAAKQRKDAIDQFTKGGREDLATDEKAELVVIESFLPEQLSREQIEVIIDETITETGATSKADLGKLMGPLMAKFGGNADGKIVKEIVDAKLS